MATKWYHNARTGEVGSYDDSKIQKEMARIMGPLDYAFTLPFDTKEKAEAWALEYGYCKKCRSATKPNDHGNCNTCGNPVDIKAVALVGARR